MNLNQIFTLGLLFRITIFITLAIWPFTHLLQGNFGPMSYQDADTDEYIYTLNLLLLKKENLTMFLNNYYEILKFNFDYDFRTITGPLFPILLGLTNYSLSTPYYLALLCFISEAICFYIWINFFYNKIKIIYIIIFSFLPIPLMFGFIHSTDIFFYLISTLVLIRIMKYKRIDNVVLFLVILSLMLRPASLAILLTIILYFTFFKNIKISNKKNFLLIFFGLISIIYYFPYFIIEINSEKVQYPYYFDNIFIFQYAIVNNEIIKLFVIFFLKFIFLFGFDPSESGYSIIQIIRSLLGVIFITGFFKSFFYRKIKIEFLYIWITVFFIAIFFYPTYRYIIPIMPLLFMLFFINKRTNW